MLPCGQVLNEGAFVMSAPNIGQKEFNADNISGDIINKKICLLDENSDISIFSILELNKYDKDE